MQDAMISTLFLLRRSINTRSRGAALYKQQGRVLAAAAVAGRAATVEPRLCGPEAGCKTFVLWQDTLFIRTTIFVRVTWKVEWSRLRAKPLADSFDWNLCLFDWNYIWGCLFWPWLIRLKLKKNPKFEMFRMLRSEHTQQVARQLPAETSDHFKFLQRAQKAIL